MRTVFKRSDGTTYGSELSKTDYFCPGCGNKEVWEEHGEGDFYEGASLYCVDCHFSFTMPSRGVDNNVVFEPNEINET